ncbi:hypothetical protein [Mesorhizobium sp. M0029]
MQKLFEPANAGLTGRRSGGIAVLAAKMFPSATSAIIICWKSYAARR